MAAKRVSQIVGLVMIRAAVAGVLPWLAAATPVTGIGPHDIITRLLDLPVPVPTWPGSRATAAPEVSESDILADDPYALKAFLGYWSYQSKLRRGAMPDDTHKHLMLEAAKRRPVQLPEVLELLPDEPRTYDHGLEVTEEILDA